MLARVPEVTAQLIGNIPRLEVVRGMLAAPSKLPRNPARPESPEESLMVLGSDILRIASDFDELEAQGLPAASALETMRKRADRYNPEILTAFASTRASGTTDDGMCELALSALRAGMVLGEDVLMTSGMLLCARGHEVTGNFVERVRNSQPRITQELICVLVPKLLPDAA